ncbi:MAG: sulfatase-like hydrolase/transferase [Flavobacterium sp.]|nr:sulfatase-like hydrolase/transferase [Flavobacterium sp.]
MKEYFRLNEYKVLFYRLLLAYIFYFISRLLFLIYNNEVLKVTSVVDFFKIHYHGMAFDTTAILYVNSLFVLLSILPFWINTHKGYQKMLFYVYFITNLLAYATNFIDLIYYKYTYARTTITAWDLVKNESNKGSMLFRFLITYWHVFLLFILCSVLWIYLYKKVRIKHIIYPKGKISYASTSIVSLLVITTFMVGGIRGDFKKSTRPINLVDANRHVTRMEQADLVLNTPFAILRTIRVKTFKKVDYELDDQVIDSLFHPIKQYKNNPKTTPNIILIITESFGREYIGAFNKDRGIKNHVSYTPFFDSLSSKSLIFPNAFANGSKSIHGMSSVLAGIPSFKDAFTSSPYSKQNIESLVSILNDQGYDTSFFHGAPNGSMGFLGFGNILGFDHYYGMTEFNDDSQFDGSWGIWDEPFFQFMNQTLSKKEGPFFTTLFTVSSHEPYLVPKHMEGKFPKGNVPIHQCVGYTDYAFKKFFEAAKKEAWFENTIFIITADHCNQVYYDEYYKIVNRLAVPILIYTPDEKYKGVDSNLSQQIDIFPTILDMIGYDKPFRSWGRSLFDTQTTTPYVINYNGQNYQFQQGNYICVFDGKKAIGFYDINDKDLQTNLISKRNKEMDRVELGCKAFLKDYFDKIIDKQLGSN